MRTHDLYPAYYITLPLYAFDCMLKKTQKNSKSQTRDPPCIYFSKMASVVVCPNVPNECRRLTTNTVKGMMELNPPNSSHILTKINSGYSMQQYLPTGGFRWLTLHEITNLDIEALSDEDDVGYVLEVDIEYSRALHDKHNDLPFLCERDIPPGGKHPKLLNTLFDKKNYTIHYRNLKQALKHGLKLIRIHRVEPIIKDKNVRPVNNWFLLCALCTYQFLTLN